MNFLTKALLGTGAVGLGAGALVAPTAIGAVKGYNTTDSYSENQQFKSMAAGAAIGTGATVAGLAGLGVAGALYANRGNLLNAGINAAPGLLYKMGQMGVDLGFKAGDKAMSMGRGLIGKVGNFVAKHPLLSMVGGYAALSSMDDNRPFESRQRLIDSTEGLSQGLWNRRNG